jgi:NADH-quinone oxidoreductase subunit F
MRDVLANLTAFYAHESCGQCTPCREGSLWMAKIAARMAAGDRRDGDPELIGSIASQIEGKTICAFGEGCAWPAGAIVNKFRDEL